MRRLWRFHSVFTVNVVLPHSWCRLISRKGDQVRDSKSKPVALSDQTWRDRLGAFSAETLYLTKFQLLAGLWKTEHAPRVRKNRIKEKRQPEKQSGGGERLPLGGGSSLHPEQGCRA